MSASCQPSEPRWHTDVIQVHDLIVANLGILGLSGDEEFMASGYRDLYHNSDPNDTTSPRVSHFGGIEREGTRFTNIYAVSHQTSPDLWSFLSCRHFMPSFDKLEVSTAMQGHVPRRKTGQTVSRAIATGRPPGSAGRDSD